MEEEELPVWSLDNHLREVRAALAIIERYPEAASLQPVCHHFGEVSPMDLITVSRVATYSYTICAIKALGLDFLSDQLEAGQHCQPSFEWLEALIPRISSIVPIYGLTYEGWTWEPRGRQPLGATKFAVINNPSGE